MGIVAVSINAWVAIVVVLGRVRAVDRAPARRHRVVVGVVIV